MPDDGDSQYRDPAAAPEKPEMLAADLVGAVVHAQEEGASDPAALRRGAAAAARLSRLAAELPLSRTDLLQMAGTMLLRCYDLSGEVADLAAGRNRLMAAASASASDDPLILAQLGLAWRSTYRHTEDPADLDRAIAADEAAVAAVRPGAAHDPQPLAGLAASLRARYLLTGDVELLDRAISLDEENLRRLAGDDAGSRSVLLHGLANAFAMRFERHGDVDDLRLLIAAREEVLASSDLADADRAYVLNALANAYSLRWSAARDGADLNRALELSAAAVAAGGADRLGRARLLRDRAELLRNRFEVRRDVADLDEAIQLYSRSLELCRPSSGDWLLGAEGLGFCHQARYAAEGDLGDLERAIELWERVASRTPRTAPEAAARHLNLGNVIRARYVRSQHRPDLDRAIAEYERSIALPAFTVDDRYTMLVDLASALQDRYDAGDDVDDLARARDCCARVLQLAERGGAQWRHAQNQLGRILVADAALTGSAATVRAAEAAFQEVLEHTTAEDPEHLQALLNLASTHARQYRVTGDDRARAAAVASFAAIMHTAAAVDPAVGAAAGRSWGGLATTDGDWAQAAAAYTAGLACLTQLHRRQSGRDHKESWLREGQGTTVDAAYALARAGDPAGAVAVLESGRAQLLSEALERVPADLRTLAATGHAELAASFRRASAAAS